MLNARQYNKNSTKLLSFIRFNFLQQQQANQMNSNMQGTMHAQANQQPQSQQSALMAGELCEAKSFGQDRKHEKSSISGNMMGGVNAASTSATSMMNQPVAGIGQQNTAALGMAPNQNLAQRQQNQNPSIMMNQGMGANVNALQQMKQNQQQLGGNMFPGGNNAAQQRQV